RGALGAGDVQWMTAGSGILHQEMPQGDAQGRMHGFQLWANLPSSLKMTAPRYQDIKAAEIPEIVDDDGTRVRVICGEFGAGAVRSRALPPIRAMSTCGSRRVDAKFCRSRPAGTPSPIFSKAPEPSGRPRNRSAVSPKKQGAGTSS